MTKKKIAVHYDDNQFLYNLGWSKESLHYGFWEKDTKNHTEALLNPIKFVCKHLGINKDDVVLDAGCGVGGTSIYIAKNYGAHVHGITLSNAQLKIAKRKALKAKVADLTDFSNRDFTKTGFRDGTFTKVCGIESICYADKKIDFLREAFRLLKNGGKIAVVDCFLKRTDFNEKEKTIYEDFLEGWAVPSLSSKGGFHDDLKKAGFKNVKFYDKFKTIRKCSDDIYVKGIIPYPFTWLLSRIGIMPKSMHGLFIGCINQKKLCDNNMVTYGVFIAEK